MTPLQLAVWLLTAGAAVAAGSYADRYRCSRSVAHYLLALLVCDLARLIIVAQLPESQEARTGADLWLRHASQAAYLAALAALPAMSLQLFFRRSSWAVWLGAAAAWGVLTTSYPAVRGVELLWVYSGLQLGAGLLSAGLLLSWAILRAEKATVPICSAGVLIAGSLAVSVLPELAGASALKNWSANVALQGFTLAIVLVLQLWGLSASSASSSATRS